MRLRLGMAIGFATGYYAGAKAGRGRYEQINRSLRKLSRSSAVDVATDKARAVVGLGIERARDAIESRVGDGRANGTAKLAKVPPADYSSSR
ncbi:MAG: hypothetical protein ACYDAD_06865 [Acidimicrobiales bacterium]